MIYIVDALGTYDILTNLRAISKPNFNIILNFLDYKGSLIQDMYILLDGRYKELLFIFTISHCSAQKAKLVGKEAV